MFFNRRLDRFRDRLIPDRRGHDWPVQFRNSLLARRHEPVRVECLDVAFVAGHQDNSVQFSVPAVAVVKPLVAAWMTLVLAPAVTITYSTQPAGRYEALLDSCRRNAGGLADQIMACRIGHETDLIRLASKRIRDRRSRAGVGDGLHRACRVRSVALGNAAIICSCSPASSRS